MQTEKQRLAQLIERYIRGAATEAEARHVERWMRDLDLGEADQLDQKAGAELKARIDQLTGHVIASPVRKLLWRWSAAASILVLISTGLYFHSAKQALTPSTELAVAERAAVPLPEVCRHTNESQEEEVITLSDGTSVILLKGSTLIWKQAFDDSSRTVELLGSGHFDVAKMPNKPFSVHSGSVTTTAIGTSFWVRQDPNIGYPEVKLITGKVVVKQRKSDSLQVLAYLNPGETLRFQKSGKFTVARPPSKKALEPVRPEPEIKEVLEFNNTPLGEVLSQLSMYYETDIQYAVDDVKGMSFYGTYDVTHEIDEILRTIGLANGLRVERQEVNGPYIIRK